MHHATIQHCIDQLMDGSELTRHAASATLLKFGASAVPPLFTSLATLRTMIYEANRREDDECLDAASKAIEECENLIVKIGQPAIPYLIKILADKNQHFDSSSILGKMGKAAVPELVLLLKYEDDNVRRLALRALRWIKDNAVVGDVMPLLTDNAVEVRREAAATLGQLLSSEELVPLMTNLLKDSDKVIRMNALEALREQGIQAKGSLKEIVECLNDDLLYKIAAEAIIEIGSSAKSAIPSLIQAMRHENPNYHEKIYNAFFVLGVDSVWSVVQALEDVNEKVRIGAAAALKDFSYRAPGEWNLVQFIAEKLRRPNWQDQRLAAIALGEIGEKAKDAVPALVELSENGASEVQAIAKEAIKKIGGWK